jgi:hypothetical protein
MVQKPSSRNPESPIRQSMVDGSPCTMVTSNKGKQIIYHLLWLLLLLVGGRGRRTGALGPTLFMAEGTSDVLVPAMAVYQDVPARRVLMLCLVLRVCFSGLHEHAALSVSCLRLCLSGSSRLTILGPW